MIKKIAFHLMLVTFFVHAAEQINYTDSPDVESNLDLFEDILNDWNPSTPALAHQGFTQIPSHVKSGHSAPRLVASTKPLTICSSKGNVSKIVLEGFGFDTSLSQNDNRKVLSQLIKSRRNQIKYRCCVSNIQLIMDWKEFTCHVRKNHSVGKKVQCPQCTTLCSTYQLGYEHIASHEHQDLFDCPRGCPTQGGIRDSQRALELHFLSCLYKDNVALPVQKETPEIVIQHAVNPINKKVIKSADKKSNESEKIAPDDELTFSKFCLTGTENNTIPSRYHITEYVAEITQVVKKNHQQRKENLIQCFTTWFGILNYIKQTKVDTKSACPLCRKTYAHSNRAASCYIQHWDTKAFECVKCTKVLKHFDEYKQHRRHCVNSKNLMPVAMSKSVSSPNKGTLVETQKKHIDSVIQKITCCGMVLNNWKVALNHVSNRHQQLNSYYICPHCKVIYGTNIKALECFIKNKDKTIFICSLCNIDCQTRENLLKHVESECIELKDTLEANNNYIPYSGVQNNIVISNMQPHVINIPPNAHQFTDSNRGIISQQAIDFADEFHYYPQDVEQTTYNPVYNNVLHHYGYANNFCPQPTNDVNYNNECITNHVTQEIVDDSIHEYHRYFKNL
ncbi:hypothetical protein Noda2021_06940 [Candidatus Dependentiae bacterium Noda2021]|nr:hypothetical protein Noda2021_06940 [Candidatus Dependentiae bacterium Noda2021]